MLFSPLFDLAITIAHTEKLFVCCLFVAACQASRGQCSFQLPARPPLADIESDLSQVGEEAKLMSYLTRRLEVCVCSRWSKPSILACSPHERTFILSASDQQPLPPLHRLSNLLPPSFAFLASSFLPLTDHHNHSLSLLLPASWTLICCPYCQLEVRLPVHFFYKRVNLHANTAIACLFPCFSFLARRSDLMCIDLLSPAAAALVRGKTLWRAVEAYLESTSHISTAEHGPMGCMPTRCALLPFLHWKLIRRPRYGYQMD